MESKRIFTFTADDSSSVIKNDCPDNRRKRQKKVEDSSATTSLDLESNHVTVIISEVVDADFSCFTWPCAAVMAQFLWHNRCLLRGKRLLEISAGTSLPGILAAKLGASVVLSEYALNPGALQRCRKQAELNHVTVETIGLIWGQVTADMLLLCNLDFILLSDVFYEPSNFSDILFTIRFLLERHKTVKCFFTNQIRDNDWNVHFLLTKFGLTCQSVALEDFSAARSDIGGSGLPGSVDVQFYQCMLE